ncbi:MAG: ATP-binding protein, partial [Pseudomonadota bacterium]
VGKTTLALSLGKEYPAIYIDLESERDRARIAEPELYLGSHLGEMVILDELHRAPGLFPVLRGLIDRARREGKGHGLYLMLGSASLELLRQPGESLAGRVSYIELSPFDVLEVSKSGDAGSLDALWLRGGFPESFLAPDDSRSLRWRRDFVRTYLERDIPQFGSRVAAEMLRRFWVMLAHGQGGLLNAAGLARNLGIDAKTAGAYIDLLVDLLLVRRLPPWRENAGKRLVKSPKVMVRDSGLVHSLLGIEEMDGLLSHPVVGASWECFVIENLLTVSPEGTDGFFYRTGGGAEIDLLLVLPNGDRWAIEVKRSLSPRVGRGFHSACADVMPAGRFVVYPGEESYPLGNDIEAISLNELARRLNGEA